MPTIPELILEPGSTYYFDSSEPTVIEVFTAGDWSGTITDQNTIDSDGVFSEVTLPSDINVSYCTISNIHINSPYKLYADETCIDGGGNNENVVFESTDKILVSGVWASIDTWYVLVSGVWKS